ncbi:MAG: SDR family oxidoreductase [Alphaproteobacteria bacterium]
MAVLGATSKTGRYLVGRLCADGHDVIALGRDRGRLDALDRRAERRVADLGRPDTVRAALAGAECVVSLAHARHTEALLAALPDACRRVVLTGSTRKFSRLADPAAEAVREGEARFLASNRRGVMLHPTMIYGAPDDRNVNRLLGLIRRWPRIVPVLLPLPDGGRRHLQPVFVDDMVEALVGALTRPSAPGKPVVVAGPEPISYREMVRACGRALGRRVYVLTVPGILLVAVARLAAGLGLALPFDASELRRASEDKRHDVSAMRERLGVAPRSFADGLRLKLERGWG